MRVLFTDLDGTLLDAATYSWEAARPALDALEAAGIPVVFNTSKTRAEAEYWRERTGNRHPFIVENGGAVVVPCGYFRCRLAGAVAEGKYDVIPLGRPYPELLRDLREAAAASEVEVAGFHQMSAGEIAQKCGLPLEQAALAKLRWYDEPFEVLEGDPARLAKAIRRRGKTYTRGGRFHHIKGRHDKLAAARVVCGLFADSHRSLFTIGVGDHWNDRTFLNAVDLPVIMDSPCARELRASIQRAVVAPSGPRGWGETITRLLAVLVARKQLSANSYQQNRLSRSLETSRLSPGLG